MSFLSRARRDEFSRPGFFLRNQTLMPALSFVRVTVPDLIYGPQQSSSTDDDGPAMSSESRAVVYAL
ncbi:uncharacterized protein CXorf67-like protein [Anopheles sinensis]|uniref:Uncharacterized protein CXorf67-like protein n=1 Tax=Anopheles sinensis TaxID=74873 RepID=A0A084W557_ANOSI|nr:uncharacterized protein CXorf67-like protein [Anopheles sinensis]